jgi:type II secretory pathway component PulF
VVTDSGSDTTQRRTRAGRTVRRRGRGRADARARRSTGRVLDGLGAPFGEEVRDGVVRGGGTPAVQPRGAWSPQHDQLQLIASLLEAGVTLDVAFDTLAMMGGSGRTREATARITVALRRGAALSDALSEVGVPGHVRALVHGGERVGQVAPAMRSAAELVGRIATLRDELRRALLYPTVVLVLGLAILVVVALVVVPPLERTFIDLGGELPAATRMVLAVSVPLRSPVTLAVLPALIALIRVLRGRWAGTFASVGAAAPVWRSIDRDVQLSVVSRLMATMLGGGLPLVDALRAVEDALGPGRVRDRVETAVRAVEAGMSALDDEALGGLLDPAERELLVVAERTGLLADQWKRVAERRAEALTGRIARIGAIAEPLLVVLVGVLVGGAVLALYLPTFRVLDLL